MRFKRDENLPLELASDLSQRGHDTDTVSSEGLTGATDVIVLRAAKSAGRILMTLDKGISRMLQDSEFSRSGVVLFRLDVSGRQSVLNFVRSRFDDLLRLELAERLTVVSATRIRLR
jgi:predicted nuclease of predicted toxin-antitoxin system